MRRCYDRRALDAARAAAELNLIRNDNLRSRQLIFGGAIELHSGARERIPECQRAVGKGERNPSRTGIRRFTKEGKESGLAIIAQQEAIACGILAHQADLALAQKTTIGKRHHVVDHVARIGDTGLGSRGIHFGDMHPDGIATHLPRCTRHGRIPDKLTGIVGATRLIAGLSRIIRIGKCSRRPLRCKYAAVGGVDKACAALWGRRTHGYPARPTEEASRRPQRATNHGVRNLRDNCGNELIIED